MSFFVGLWGLHATPLPGLAGVREQFRPTLDWMVEHSPHWVLALEHDLEPFLRLLWPTRRLMEPPSIQQVVREHGLSCVRLYTDGSCFAPTCPQASHAAWSVVLDLAPHESPFGGP